MIEYRIQNTVDRILNVKKPVNDNRIRAFVLDSQ